MIYYKSVFKKEDKKGGEVQGVEVSSTRVFFSEILRTKKSVLLFEGTQRTRKVRV